MRWGLIQKGFMVTVSRIFLIGGGMMVVVMRSLNHGVHWEVWGVCEGMFSGCETFLCLLPRAPLAEQCYWHNNGGFAVNTNVQKCQRADTFSPKPDIAIVKDGLDVLGVSSYRSVFTFSLVLLWWSWIYHRDSEPRESWMNSKPLLFDFPNPASL